MTPYDTDRFDAYVRGELSAEERARIEATLAEDRARGGDAARDWDELSAAAEATARAGVRARVNAATERYRAVAAPSSTPAAKSGAIVRPLWRRSWAAAAAALLIVAGGGYFLLAGAGAPQTPEALAAAYFEPAIGLPTLLGPEEDIRFEDGMVDYKLGDFEAAARKWRPLVGEDFDQDTLAYFLAVAELAAGRPDAALEDLGRVRTPALQPGRQWYEAVGLLMLGRDADARPLLEAVRAGGGRWSAQAGEVLEELAE